MFYCISSPRLSPLLPPSLFVLLNRHCISLVLFAFPSPHLLNPLTLHCIVTAFPFPHSYFFLLSIDALPHFKLSNNLSSFTFTFLPSFATPFTSIKVLLHNSLGIKLVYLILLWGDKDDTWPHIFTIRPYPFPLWLPGFQCTNISQVFLPIFLYFSSHTFLFLPTTHTTLILTLLVFLQTYPLSPFLPVSFFLPSSSFPKFFYSYELLSLSPT